MRRGHHLDRLVPGHSHEAAFAAGLLVPASAFGVVDDVGPRRGRRVTERVAASR
jgi:hypothetical protein